MATRILRSPPSSLRLLRFSPPSTAIFNYNEGCVASRFLGTLAFDEIRVSDDVKRPYTSTALVLHGLLGSGRNWKSFARNLAERLRTTTTSNSSQGNFAYVRFLISNFAYGPIFCVSYT